MRIKIDVAVYGETRKYDARARRRLEIETDPTTSTLVKVGTAIESLVYHAVKEAIKAEAAEKAGAEGKQSPSDEPPDELSDEDDYGHHNHGKDFF